MSLIQEIILYHEANLCAYLHNALYKLAKYLGMNTLFLRSSDVIAVKTSSGQEHILELCKQRKAGRYINLSGGRDLYDANDFKQKQIELNFIDMNGSDDLKLSVIDSLMQYDKQTLKQQLRSYTLNKN